MNLFYLYISCIAVLDLGGMLSGKMWNITRQPVYLVVTCLAFTVAGFFFALSLRYEGMAITNIFWIAVSTVLTTIAGYFVFKEQISSVQFIGVLIIIIGVALINWR
ncbi:MAG: EamA family transporter [Patescibacteria group bacterium]